MGILLNAEVSLARAELESQISDLNDHLLIPPVMSGDISMVLGSG